MFARVNTSIVPTCFSLRDNANMPVDVYACLINENPIILSAGVTQIEHRVIVANFDNFTLLLDGVFNSVECFDTGFNYYMRIMTTLSKETTIVYIM